MDRDQAAVSTQIARGVRLAGKWIGLPLLAVVAVFVVAGIVVSIQAERDLEKVAEGATLTYPSAMVVCEGLVDGRCATRAADRAERTVAWMSEGDDLESKVLIAARQRGQSGPLPQGAIFQEAGLGDVLITLYSHPRDREAGERLGVVTHDGTSAEMYRATDGTSVVLEWRRRGQRYQLAALELELNSSINEAEAAARKAFALVRYESPPRA